MEQSLRRAALWDEVKDKLQQSAYGLSGGQQQRLVHRARAGGGSGSAAAGRALFGAGPDRHRQNRGSAVTLKDQCTQVIVTHNMQQAARVAEFTAILSAGQADRVRPDSAIIYDAGRSTKEDYITGRFG